VTQNGRQPIEVGGKFVSLIGQAAVAPGDWQFQEPCFETPPDHRAPGCDYFKFGNSKEISSSSLSLTGICTLEYLCVYLNLTG